MVPVGNTWVRANCSAHDDLRPVKMYLMNVANEKSRSACANCQSDENRHFGKTGEIYLAEGSHFEQSACMRRSVRVFAVATFQKILIKCLFFNEKKAYVFDKNAILTPDHVRQHRR